MKKLIVLSFVLALSFTTVAHAKPKVTAPITPVSFNCSTGFWTGPKVGPRPSPSC